jgi:hypothetical protein
MYCQIDPIWWTRLQEILAKGVPTATMKEWLLYMEPVV